MQRVITNGWYCIQICLRIDQLFPIFTAQKLSCGKVMFSQVSVILFGRGSHVTITHDAFGHGYPLTYCSLYTTHGTSPRYQIPDMRPTPSCYWHLVVNIKWWPPKHVQLARGRYASYSNGVLSMFTLKNHFTRTFRNDTFTILVATICYHQIVSDSEKHFLHKVRNFFWGDMVGDVTSSPTCHRSFLLLHVWRCTPKDIFYRAFHLELCVKS